MKRHIRLYKQLFVILTLLSSILIHFTCSTFISRDVVIKDIRIEEIGINKFYAPNPEVESYTARWSGSRINLHAGEEADAPLITSFSQENEYEFIGSNPAVGPLYARVISGKSNAELNWDNIKNVDDPAAYKLIFEIVPDEPDIPYEDMVYIPGGSVMMGSKYQKDEQPVHRVTVDGFYMDRYEVTVAQYREFCRATRRAMPKQPYWNNDNHPVVKVSWNNANAYAKWKKKRLPSEAEWEYAARAGRKGYFYSWGNKAPGRRKGGNIADEALRSEKKFWRIWKNYYDGFVYTAPRGSFYSNDFGLFDMTGNVWEWCSDWYTANYYKSSPEKNPPGPEKASHKVLRGGSWNFAPRDVLATRRLHYRSDVELDYIGFRCAKDK
jgi:sulfatase modifying factor 1